MSSSAYSCIVNGIKLGLKIRTPFITWECLGVSWNLNNGKLHDRSFCENECVIMSTQNVHNGKTYFTQRTVKQRIHLKGTHYLYELCSTLDQTTYYFIHYRFNKDGSLIIYLIHPSSVQNLIKYINEHNSIPQDILDNIDKFKRKD